MCKLPCDFDEQLLFRSFLFSVLLRCISAAEDLSRRAYGGRGRPGGGSGRLLGRAASREKAAETVTSTQSEPGGWWRLTPPGGRARDGGRTELR